MKLSKAIKLLGALGISTMLISCGDDEPVTNVFNEVKEESQKLQIRETWISDCHNSELLNSAVRENWDFGNETFVQRYDLYSDEACTQPVGNVNMSGTFDIQAIDGQNDTYDLNLIYTSVKVTPQTEFVTGVLSTVNFCGVEEWTVGAEITIESIAGESCFITAIPENRYGKVNIDDSQDKLYLSSSFSKTTADRPQTIDSTKVYNEVD